MVQIDPARCDALLGAIAADPTSVAPRLVFGDWLQSIGHPWGQLIGLQHGAPGSPEIEKLLADDVTGLKPFVAEGSTFTWRCGFVEEATLRIADNDWGNTLQAFFHAPAARALGKLIVDAQPASLTTYRDWSLSDRNVIDPWAVALEAVRTRVPAHVKRVSLGASPPEPGTAYVRMPDFRAVSAALAGVEELEIAGLARAATAPLDLPSVRRLELRFAYATAQGIEAIGKSNLPACERLSVWFGGEVNCILDDIHPPAERPYRDDEDEEDEDADFQRYPPSYTTDELGALGVERVNASGTARLVGQLLHGTLPPGLRELGIQSAVLDAGVIETIASAPVVKQLARLDLSRGSLSKDGAKALRDAEPALRHLTIDQPANDSDPDFFFRYVATME